MKVPSLYLTLWHIGHLGLLRLLYMQSPRRILNIKAQDMRRPSPMFLRWEQDVANARKTRAASESNSPTKVVIACLSSARANGVTQPARCPLIFVSLRAARSSTPFFFAASFFAASRCKALLFLCFSPTRCDCKVKETLLEHRGIKEQDTPCWLHRAILNSLHKERVMDSTYAPHTGMSGKNKRIAVQSSSLTCLYTFPPSSVK